MKNILVVDDDPTIVDIIEDLLKRNGFNTWPAYDAQEAEIAIKRKKPDLILLDIMLPKIDGFTFLKNLKANPEFKDIPVICVTVLNKKEDLEKGKSLGAADYITKPFDPDDLVARIKKVLNLN
ncbi:MAG: response regulator [Candidatus Margulisiibacteriota bacterium]